MAQKYGFFNSVNNDRVYDASDVARFLSKFFTNGIFNNSLAVSSNDNMTVSVATGQANINGYGYENTEILTLDIDDADSELNRIDSVIVRLDLTNRQITTMILQGQYATTPSQPSIIRSGNVYDLRLANILVSAGATRITTEDITDTRFGSDCGNVTQAVLELDTSEIFNQYETWFTNWYQNLQDQLDDNQAGHLQNEIDEINNNIVEINNDIDGINQTVSENYQEQQDIQVQINALATYSTEEQIVGKWIDDKPIYRKVCVINSPVVGTISYAHYISNFKTLISATANGTQANGGQQYFPRAVPGDTNWSLNIGDVNSTTFSLQIANNNTGNYAFTEVNVILEYTKTTD